MNNNKYIYTSATRIEFERFASATLCLDKMSISALFKEQLMQWQGIGKIVGMR